MSGHAPAHEQARAAWSTALELYRAQGRDHDATRVRRQLDELDASGDTTGALDG
jgi:hypothetical protein